MNGAYHASVRYSALHALHEKLHETFGYRLGAVEFPPKKIWRTLDDEAVNKRREELVKYFHGGKRYFERPFYVCGLLFFFSATKRRRRKAFNY